MSESVDDGDWLVSQVGARIGALTSDEHAAVYGAGFSYAASSNAPLPAETIGWVAAVLQAFRTRECPYCGHGLLEHSLAINETGPTVTCDQDSTSRPAWQWHAGPQPTPAWRILLGVVLWVGIPLVSVGLASWLMPLIAAASRRRRNWAVAAFAWGVVTVALVVFIERGIEGPALGFVAIAIWFGSALYGGFQVKPWASASGARRQ